MFTRTEANKSDGVFVEIDRILSSALGRAATDAERQRAAFELTWAKESFSGKPLTPGDIAQYFRDQVETLRASKEFRQDPESKPLLADILRWEAQAAEWDRIDAAKLDAEVVARVREAAKPLGDKNDLLIAAAVGRPVDEVKRQNYIRMLVIDPDFEVAVRARKAERNVGKTSPKALIRSQKRIRVIAAKMREKAKPGGYGKSGAAKSRKRFAELRAELVLELRRAERAARVLGDDVLADQYREYRSSVVLSRVGAVERGVALADEVARVGRLEARVEDVPVAARESYLAALEVHAACEYDAWVSLYRDWETDRKSTRLNSSHRL